jgi:hypothetical protein
MGKQSRLVLAGTSIASALLLLAGGATAAHASTARHNTVHPGTVHPGTVHPGTVHHSAARHRARRHQRTRRWYRHAGQSQCETWARAHNFEYLKAAHHAPGGAATLIAKHATVVCGGAGDWHFVYGTIPGPSFVENNARIQVLATTGAGIGFKVIRTTRLVKYLPHDEWTRTFQLTGPPDAITALEEIYHP